MAPGRLRGADEGRARPRRRLPGPSTGVEVGPRRRRRVVDLKTGSSKPTKDEVRRHGQLGAYQVAVEGGALHRARGPLGRSGPPPARPRRQPVDDAPGAGRRSRSTTSRAGPTTSSPRRPTAWPPRPSPPPRVRSAAPARSRTRARHSPRGGGCERPAPRWSAAGLARALGQSHAPTARAGGRHRGAAAPLLVVAGAGSGKTETMAGPGRVARRQRPRAPRRGPRPHLHPQGRGGAVRAARHPPHGAARGRDLAPTRGDGAVVLDDVPTVSTYHAYAGRIVREHGLRVGVEPESRLLTEAAAWQFAHEAVVAWDGPMDEVDKAESTVTDRGRRPRRGAGRAPRRCAGPRRAPRRRRRRARVRPEGRGHPQARPPDARRRRCPAPARGGRPCPRAPTRSSSGRATPWTSPTRWPSPPGSPREVEKVGVAERGRFKAVLLDEFQDTSEAQLQLLRSLFVAPGSPVPVTAVGDPHQSIYGWRGASSTTLDRFRDDFRDPDARRRCCTCRRAGATTAPSSPPPTSSPGRSPRRRGCPSSAARRAARRRPGPRVGGAARDDRGRGAATSSTGCSGALAPTGRRTGSRAVPQAIPVRRRRRGARAGAGARTRSSASAACCTRPRSPTSSPCSTSCRTRPAATALDAAAHRAVVPARRRRPRRRSASGRGRGRALGGAAATAEARPVARRERAPSIVEALDDLPPATWVGGEGQRLSPVALTAPRRGSARRCGGLRALTGLGLPELVAEAEHSLGLDIEVLARPGYCPGRPRAPRRLRRRRGHVRGERRPRRPSAASSPGSRPPSTRSAGSTSAGSRPAPTPCR